MSDGFQSFVLYTYLPSQGAGQEPECHVYGPGTQQECQAEGEKLQGEQPRMGFMVLPLQPLGA